MFLKEFQSLRAKRKMRTRLDIKCVKNLIELEGLIKREKPVDQY